MGQDIYDETHVTMCRLLERRHNNPLGEAAWPMLERLLRRDRPRVLDVGCGRGASAIDWARRGADVVGLDPSGAMIAEACRNAAADPFAGGASFEQGLLGSWQSGAAFDLVLLHDVLCYVADRTQVMAAALGHLTPGGIASVTDYHGLPGIPAVDSVTNAWGIGIPIPFEEHARALERAGARLLLHVDTTRQYRAHWEALLGRLRDRRRELDGHVGRPAVEHFEEQILSILMAVDSGRFGHLWAVLEVPW